MPQVDVLVSVCTVTDPKFTDDDLPESPRAAEEFVPAESFWLSGDAEFDWFDRNAFLERKESTRGNMMTMSSKNHNQADSNSQRFTTRNLKSNPPAAATIFGLSNTQKKKSNHVDKRCGGRKNNNKPPIMRLFPSKRSESIKSTAATTEPSSPKVSCIGRVRSKKGRRRKSAAAEKSTVERTRSEPDGEKKKKKKGLGFYSGLKSLFRSDRRCRNESAVRISQPAAAVKLSPSSKKHEGDDSECEPLGLKMMTRYVSGRRSESWIDDDVAINDSMESFRRRGPPGG